ncbi:MAG TPA: ribosome biogenesis GTPase Der [Bacteroidales bacterium]|jgi:GTP-binding protein|nr:ribosome biogenesis GTPase Der [Bacteroidales bacterium]
MGNIVAIVGRPNVGKSTLFNRLVGQKDAIVDEQAGVTRDRHYGRAEWSGAEFTVIDTGGFVVNSDDIFEEEIRKQVKLAIDEANVIVFLVDVGSGITDLDESVAGLLRRAKKPVILAANKVDTFDMQYQASEFYKLGLGDVFTISSMNGSGTGEFLDELVKKLPAPAVVEDTTGLPKIAIVGRPNVGKSSLTNALLGEDRNIVTPVAGTTRDSIYSRYKKFGFDFFLIDTAGLRKKGKVTEDLEFYSVMRAIRTIEHADVCLLMLDATQPMEAQDVNIFRLIQRNNKGIVLLVNKWDLVEKDTHSTKIFTEAILRKIAPFTDIPIIFVSALTKLRIQKVLETAIEVFENRKRRVSTSQLNEIMLQVIEENEPPAIKGKLVKIKYVTQLPTNFPSFAFFCNLPQYVKEPYKRYLENRLRENFNFKGNPIQIFFRQK